QDRDSRHLYDIAKLLPEVKFTPELKALIIEVREDRMQSKNNPSAQLKYNIPEMLKEIISSRFYESDYNNITKKLLYEEMSYEEAIRRGISIVAESDAFLYKG
ncbi:MAG: nucleotidyl transferase AbiEii/AbiGii toxin family protein, partial [Lachnospiraceae bacterium]|nr:nucleotidyl transferase AbiEii/AbiGii toxin family protein [Lachnospiraceae bacterium]